MGGRYQTTHESFNGHDSLKLFVTGASLVSSVVGVCRFDLEAPPGPAEVALIAPLGRLSPGADDALPLAAALPQSKAVPGVLGVLFAEPNEANAPDPKPNAEDAPVPGDATLAGETELKGFDFEPCEEESPPNRLEAKLRGGSPFPSSDTGIESLPALHSGDH